MAWLISNIELFLFLLKNYNIVGFTLLTALYYIPTATCVLTIAVPDRLGVSIPVISIVSEFTVYYMNILFLKLINSYVVSLIL